MGHTFFTEVQTKNVGVEKIAILLEHHSNDCCGQDSQVDAKNISYTSDK